MPLHFRALIGVARQDEQESPVPEIISRKVVTNSWGMGVESRATKFGLKFDLRTRCFHIYIRDEMMVKYPLGAKQSVMVSEGFSVGVGNVVVMVLAKKINCKPSTVCLIFKGH